MDIKKRGHNPEGRMNQCIFRVKNCQMEGDGTWDCSATFKDCLIVHTQRDLRGPMKATVSSLEGGKNLRAVIRIVTAKQE